MPESLYALALLACPVGMGAMMWMMMRGSKTSAAEDNSHKQAELIALQAQLDQLKPRTGTAAVFLRGPLIGHD